MKRFTSKLSAVIVSACMVLPTLSNGVAIIYQNVAVAAEMADSAIKFNNEDHFFVYVGTYGQSTPQFRYIYPNSMGSYTADKVLWEDAPSDISYGDIFIAWGDVTMTQVYPAADDPVNAHVSFYTLDEGAELSKAGNCSDIMEQKDLTVTSMIYDGSSHWSVRYMDATGDEYYYGLSKYASNLLVDPLDCEIGDVYTYALYNDNMVVPLAKKESSVSYGIGVSQPPEKTVYQIGEELDLTGLRLNGSYTEGELVACIINEDYQELLDSNVPIEIDTSEYDNTKAGTYPIYVMYGDAKYSFTVAVLDDEPASGDVNGDDEFNVADVVLLQKWMLAIPDTNLANWQAADFCKDGRLDVFDLCLMKRTLLNQNHSRLPKVTYVRSMSEEFQAALVKCLADTDSLFDFSEYTLNALAPSYILDENKEQIGDQRFIRLYYKDIELDYFQNSIYAVYDYESGELNLTNGMELFSDKRLENLTLADMNAEIDENGAKEGAAAFAKTMTVPAKQMDSTVDAILTGMNTDTCNLVLCNVEHPYLAYRIWDHSAPYQFTYGTPTRKTTAIDLVVYVDAHTGEVIDSVTEVYSFYY